MFAPLNMYNALKSVWLIIWKLRCNNGKIDIKRAEEYRGVASCARPQGGIIWIHAVSVGESLSTLPLILALRQRYPALSILLTTSTHTSLQRIQSELPDGVVHQYLPMDHPQWVQRFYDHWQPNIGIWVESETWPNLIFAADRREMPRLLLNGKMSKKSVRNWSFFPRTSRAIFRGYKLVRVQDQQNLGFFLSFDVTQTKIGANLKDAAAPLKNITALYACWHSRLVGRKFWLASSTHAGEEEIILQAHQILRQTFPDLLCILVPRHVERGVYLQQKTFSDSGLKVQLDSQSDGLDVDCGVYIVDAMGQLGVFYRLALMAFIGGSLVPKGGHNMREALLLQCLPIVGPHLENFSTHKEDFKEYYATASDAQSLANAVEQRLCNPEHYTEQASIAAQAAEDGVSGVMDTILNDLAPFIDPIDKSCSV